MKTLKDLEATNLIERVEEDKDKQRVYYYDGVKVIKIEDLKQEAIKHLKSLSPESVNRVFHISYDASDDGDFQRADWIIDFFNITEEDLK